MKVCHGISTLCHPPAGQTSSLLHSTRRIALVGYILALAHGVGGVALKGGASFALPLGVARASVAEGMTRTLN